MASQARQAKVLRIGVIQDGKIVQERLIKAGESVSVGESAKNTFVLPKAQPPSADFVLFRSAGRGYSLQFTDKMKGKISSGGAVVALQKMAGDPSVSRKGDTMQLPLAEQDRGKIKIQDVTVLFQFVAPPPVTAVRPIQQMDFRPRLIEDDDPVFLGFLAIWSALAMVLVIWVWNTPVREVTLTDIPDRFAKIVLAEEPPVPEEVVVEPEEVDGTAIEREVEEVPEPTVHGDKDKEEPKSEAQQIQEEEEKKAELIANSPLLLKIIGTTGESQGGVVENLFSDDELGLGDIDKALDQTAGVTLNSGDAGLREGRAGGNDSADIGDLKGVGGGQAASVSGPVVTLKPRVTAQSGQIDASGDESAIKGVVRKYSGQLTYCYEKRLKTVPTLGGRIEVGWTVSGGSVSGAPYVVANTTGDAELASCITQKIRRWSFPADVDGDLSWPFVFQQKE